MSAGVAVVESAVESQERPRRGPHDMRNVSLNEAAIEDVQPDVTDSQIGKQNGGWESQIPTEFGIHTEMLKAGGQAVSFEEEESLEPRRDKQAKLPGSSQTVGVIPNPSRELDTSHTTRVVRNPSGELSQTHDSSTTEIGGTRVLSPNDILTPNDILNTPEAPTKSWGPTSKSMTASFFLARRRSAKRISAIIEQERPGFTFEALELDETTGEMKKMQVQMGIWYHIRLTLQTTLMSLPFVISLILVSLFVPSGIPNCHLGKEHCHLEWTLAQSVHALLSWFTPAAICLGNVEWFMNFNRIKQMLFWWFCRFSIAYNAFFFMLTQSYGPNQEKYLFLYIIVGHGCACAAFFPFLEVSRLGLGYVEDYWDPRKMFSDPDYEEKLRTQSNLDLEGSSWIASWLARKKNLLQKAWGTNCIAIGVIALVGLSAIDVAYNRFSLMSRTV